MTSINKVIEKNLQLIVFITMLLKKKLFKTLICLMLLIIQRFRTVTQPETNA